ncbi:MAG TPA: hypothetical protein EYQ58_02735 [Candidatus Poseidoniales archaeon]|nr:hypothetical protein [Candidatus Poseidoniales archaeon]
MGIEMVLLLVEIPCLEKLLSLSWQDLYSGLEKGKLRETRPAQDEQLKSIFAIDAEAEILDWMDETAKEQTVELTQTMKSNLQTIINGEEGLLKIMHWASPGAWEVWEARAFLYLEMALGESVNHVEDLYTQWLWDEVCEKLNGYPQAEFASKVCLDWMDRRKKLGETLDENLDAKIIPTYQAHESASIKLVHTITRWQSEENLVGILGREHLDASKWGHGELNLRQYLQP